MGKLGVFPAQGQVHKLFPVPAPPFTVPLEIGSAGSGILHSAKSLLVVKIEILLGKNRSIALLVFLLALAPLPQLDTSVS